MSNYFRENLPFFYPHANLLFYFRVMTTLDFNSVERDCFKQAGRDPAKDRIEKVQKAILNYGVDPKYLFRLDDVLHKENTAKVIRTLEEVAKIVSCSLKYMSHSKLKIHA